MSKKKIKTLIYLSLGLIALTINSCLLSEFLPIKDTSFSKNEITSAIVNIDFPSEIIEYPQDWPDDLRFSFKSVCGLFNIVLALEGDKQVLPVKKPS